MGVGFCLCRWPGRLGLHWERRHPRRHQNNRMPPRRRCFQEGQTYLFLGAILWFLGIACKVKDMKGVVQGLPRRLNRKVIALIASIVMASPISASMLCIAPGEHVAVENLSAHCCASLEIPGYEQHSQNEAIRAQDECLNCTDLPLLSNDPGTIRRCYDFSASTVFADEYCPDLFIAFTASQHLLQKTYPKFLISSCSSSSVPLRC
jgi:hypothetical protein